MFFREVLSALSLRRVRYCVVGGVAVNLHGVPRMTYDLDLVLWPERADLAAAVDVLGDLGLRCRLDDLDLREFADPDAVARARVERNLIAVTYSDPDDPLREVDVLVAPVVDPRELLERAIELDLQGLVVKVATLADLITLKRAGGRAHDLADLEHLERIRDGSSDGR